MRKKSGRQAAFDAATPPKLTVEEFCRYSWVALKQVKPIGIPIYVAANVYAALGGWPFPEGRYISILGIFVFIAWFTIIETKLKKAFSEAKTAAKAQEVC